MLAPTYPVRFTVDYPRHPLNRITTLFRVFLFVPICILLGAVSGAAWGGASHRSAFTIAGAGGLLFIGPALMILFRRKYPRWWFDWNLQLQRFGNRVFAYLALMDDRYPSTDDEQSVHLAYRYPDVEHDLNRWLPLVKWLLVVPHLIVLFPLTIGAAFVVLAAWVTILFTGEYPPWAFRYVEGVMRWHNRVLSYAFVLVTDEYPPFRLTA